MKAPRHYLHLLIPAFVLSAAYLFSGFSPAPEEPEPDDQLYTDRDFLRCRVEQE